MPWLAASILALSAGLAGCASTPPIASTVPATVSQSTSIVDVLGKRKPKPSPTASPAPIPSSGIRRTSFAGAFFRAEGSPPYGIFASTGTEPQPYPTPGAGYCSQRAANGASINGSDVVDATKLSNIVNLGIKWTRMTASAFNDDTSHVFGSGSYNWTDLDSAQCATLVAHNITPVIGLEAGPVQYDSVPGTFSPQIQPIYRSAADFGAYCGAVAAHEKTAFPSVSKFSLPGNEINTNPQLFPGGLPQISDYSQACYAAIKVANPSTFVYGFELNMDGQVNATDFVRQLYNLGCRVGTCYDGIAMHLTLVYPVPSSGTPCYPNPGGAYSLQCITDMQSAAQAPGMHVLISENVYPIPGNVPDEATKAAAIVAEYSAYAQDQFVDGVSYANVDECSSYPNGYFANGCLVANGTLEPAYNALQALALQNFQ